MAIEVHIVNAFIDGDTGGNPAGVVVDANQLSTDQKQAVASQVGLSETAFVSRSSIATLKLEFFTPTQQIAHCGHATIATFSLLRQLGVLSEGRHTKETIDGNRNILIESDAAFMQQRVPSYLPITEEHEAFRAVLQSLNISSDLLLDVHVPQVVNTGNSFLILPIVDEETLLSLEPSFSAVEAISKQFDLIGYYAFTLSVKNPGRIAGTRMFAPRYGIKEEAGTGMAAGSLACYLYDVVNQKKADMLIEQGWLMPSVSPCVISVKLELSDGKIVGLMAGGRAASVEVVRVEV